MVYDEAVYIKVKVKAGAKNERIVKTSDTTFEMSVREEATGNAANSRVVKIIAAHFGISAKRVRIVSGHHRPSKLLSITLDKAERGR